MNMCSFVITLWYTCGQSVCVEWGCGGLRVHVSAQLSLSFARTFSLRHAYLPSRVCACQERAMDLAAALLSNGDPDTCAELAVKVGGRNLDHR